MFGVDLLTVINFGAVFVVLRLCVVGLGLDFGGCLIWLGCGLLVCMMVLMCVMLVWFMFLLDSGCGLVLWWLDVLWVIGSLVVGFAVGFDCVDLCDRLVMVRLLGLLLACVFV